MSTADITCRYVYSGRLHAPRGQVFRPHAHDCREVVLVLRGHLQVRIAGTDAVAGPGDLLCYAAGAEHREAVTRAGPCDWLYLLATIPPATRPWALLRQDRDGVAQQILSLIGAAAAANDGASARKRDALCAALVAEIDRLQEGGSDGGDALVAEIHHYIRRHLAEPLGLERLALVAGLSRAHFARLFHERSGATVMEAVRAARLAAARDLLLTSDLPLSEIAPRVGIGSEALLSRLLARHLGVGARTLRRGRRRIGVT